MSKNEHMGENSTHKTHYFRVKLLAELSAIHNNEFPRAFLKKNKKHSQIAAKTWRIESKLGQMSTEI